MAAGFEILEHTADIGVRAWGRTPDEAFVQAVRGLFHLMYDPEKVVPRLVREVDVEAEGYEYLLVDLFNEILYLFDAEKLAFADVEIEHLSPQRVRVRLRGEPFDPSRHEGRIYVKAATLHQLKSEEREGSWIFEIYVDI